jgi:hypothetical protein
LSAPIFKAGKILLLAMMLQLLTGCALSSRSHVDVATPSSQEFQEFDAVVNLPLSTAYQNILNNAPACWCSPFSGQILAYAPPRADLPHQISFVVPGKFLGSKVELATVRLYAQDEQNTRIVGSSFVYPGTWRLAELTDWANSVSGICAVPRQPAS